MAEKTAHHAAYSDRLAAKSSVRYWPLLFPSFYGLHVAEEFWCGDGFADWLATTTGANISESEFLIINGIAWPLMLFAALMAIRHERLAWLTISLATIVLVNGAAHLLSSVLTGTYSPGMLTGTLLYLPLGIFGFRRSNRTAGGRHFSTAVAVGILLHAVVFIVAYG